MARLHGYNTLLPQEKQEMLAAIGVKTESDLFAHIPASVKFNGTLNLPAARTEWNLTRHMEQLAGANQNTKTHLNFMGAGAYEHYIPAVIDTIINRGEFITSYTPYQPEISQGLLQALYEYQQALSCITGLPVVNGSCYDGATAMADAAWIACLITTRREKILLSQTLWDQTKDVVKTYMDGRDIEIIPVKADAETGEIDQQDLQTKIKAHNPAGFLCQSPNAKGVLEPVEQIAKICRENNVVSILSFNPLTSGLHTPPGKLGIDIATCDGQVLGIPLSAGGPSLGVFATKQEYKKYVPGRLVGKVTDINGNLAYALVYEDREQHVARENATSNICSNQALNALRAVIYLTHVGERGLHNIAQLNHLKAKYLCDELLKISGITRTTNGSFFNEFEIRLPHPAQKIFDDLHQQNIFAGYVTGENTLLIAVTETKSKQDLDLFVTSIKKTMGVS